MHVVAQCGAQSGLVPASPMGFVRRASLVAQAGFLLLGLAATATAEDQNARDLSHLHNVGIDQRLSDQVPLDLKFRDENGKTVTLGSYFSKGPVILSLVYYTCTMMCTLTEHSLVNSLRDIKANIGEQYQVVTVSFDPTDTPELAKAQKATYVELYGRPGAGQGWHFLVGEQPSIQALTRAVGFRYRYMMNMDEFEHATGIIVLTPEGRISRYFLGIEYPSTDVRAALIDASHEKMGKPADEARMLQKGRSTTGSLAADSGLVKAAQPATGVTGKQ
jgi:protein SCO1/2